MYLIDSGISRLGKVIKASYIQREIASGKGLFHGLDARVKVLFLIFFVVIVSLKKEIMPEAAITFFVLAIAVLSRLDILSLYRKVFFFGFVFGFLIALPAALNVVTKGEVILPVLRFSKAYDFGIYHVPATIGITAEGVSTVVMLTLRVINSVSLSFLVLYTTPFADIIRALKVFKVPDAVLMIITLTYKYIFIFAKTIEDMHLAKKSRTAGGINNKEAREWIAGRIAFMFKKSRQRCEDVFNAMIARGFSDTVAIYGFKKMDKRDAAAGCVLFSAGIIFLWV